MAVVALGPERCDALLAFFAACRRATAPSSGRRSPTRTPSARGRAAPGPVAGGWPSTPRGGCRREVTGYVAVRPLPGVVGPRRRGALVVAPSHRGSGLGRELARRGLVQAVGSGLSKLVVEVVAEQGAALALFTDLGFTGEALLCDHIRDRTAQLRDLMVLAHHVRDVGRHGHRRVADELRPDGE